MHTAPGSIFPQSNPGLTRLVSLSILDQDHLMLCFSEGEVRFLDDQPGFVPDYTNDAHPEDNWVESYGPLDLDRACTPGTWSIVSPDDPAFGPAGIAPVQIFRKTKITGMAQLAWNKPLHDFDYQCPLGHTLYLKLPSPMLQGMTYRLAGIPGLFEAVCPLEFQVDWFSSVSEAVHVCLSGYPLLPDGTKMPADLYHWMGDGGARDYGAFEGQSLFLVNQTSGERHPAGQVGHALPRSLDFVRGELAGYDFTASPVWPVDFEANPGEGSWRLVIPGVGASPVFQIGKRAFKAAFDTSLRGFYYMRLGEPIRPDISPVPRQPAFIPHESPADCRILITTMHPWHPEWKTFAPGDKWDPAHCWEPYVKPGRPENTRARGGHSDALDWDRHLGHVGIIYDLLLPYLLTGGACGDDDSGIGESHNAIPDLLDEARNEVDFWLSLRDGEGYSHGITNPDQNHTFYQAANTCMAAWANALNCAMLADCFRISGHSELQEHYLAQALEAWNYASAQDEQDLEKVQGIGDGGMRGADFRLSAAAFLYNLTGRDEFGQAAAAIKAGDGTSDVIARDTNQVWAAAAILVCPHELPVPGLQEALNQALLHHGEIQAQWTDKRATRRATAQETGYFHTAQNVHRIILAHHAAQPGPLKDQLLSALLLEASWGLGRNPLNMVQMTTASSSLQGHRSIENAYTSGRRDGSPGLHPGHTPYLNTFDWGSGMIMSRPRWMAALGYPDMENWPQGELCFNTRWVWAHTEFTPQQTMRGKMALYAYLHGQLH